MIKHLRKTHANLRYTEYPKTGHQVWDKAFSEPDLVPWLAAQKRAQPAEGQVGSRETPSAH